MKAIWSAMENTATSWRKVFKGLALLDHLIKNGNERIIEETRDHMRRIRPLGDFNFYEAGIDRGSGGKHFFELCT
jgi:epsin